MAKDTSFHDYIIYDLLKDIPGITSRSMFGGWGVYKDGVIFAILVEGELYFKTDDTSRADFEKAGSHPFTYSRKDSKRVALSYWSLPLEVMENKKMLYQYIERSVKTGKSVCK